MKWCRGGGGGRSLVARQSGPPLSEVETALSNAMVLAARPSKRPPGIERFPLPSLM